MQPPANLFTSLTPHLPDELFTSLLEAANVRIERIVSHGHESPEGFRFVKRKRREVRRTLAQRSKELLARYRQGESGGEACPLKKTLASQRPTAC